MALSPELEQLRMTLQERRAQREAEAASRPRPGQNTSALGDAMTDLQMGVARTPGTLAGLADIPLNLAGANNPIQRATGAIGEFTGFQPGAWGDSRRANLSPQRLASEGRVEESRKRAEELRASGDTWGARGEAIKGVLSEPRAAAGMALQSLPEMVAGGVMARGLSAAGALNRVSKPLRPYVGAGIGEGAVMAGHMSKELMEDGVDPQRAALYSLGTGALGGAIGLGGGLVSRRMGLTDPDVWLAGGGRAAARAGSSEAARTGLAAGAGRMAARVAGGAVAEGVVEEFPQEYMEAVMANLANRRDPFEGAFFQGVQGAYSGGMMGGAMNIPGARQPKDLTRTGEPTPQPPAGGSNALADIAAKYPETPVQQWVDSLVGVNQGQMTKAQRKKYETELKAALDEPSGVYTNDENGIERELTVREVFEREAGFTEPVVDEATPAGTAQGNPLVAELREAFPKGSPKIMERAAENYGQRSTEELIETIDALNGNRNKAAWHIPLIQKILEVRGVDLSQVDAASSEGQGTDTGGSAGVVDGSLAGIGGVRDVAGAPARSSGESAPVGVGEPVVPAALTFPEVPTDASPESGASFGQGVRNYFVQFTSQLPQEQQSALQSVFESFQGTRDVVQFVLNAREGLIEQKRAELGRELTPAETKKVDAEVGKLQAQLAENEDSPIRTSFRAAALGSGVSHTTVQNRFNAAMSAINQEAEARGVDPEAVLEILGLSEPQVAELMSSISEAEAASMGLSYRRSGGPRTVQGDNFTYDDQESDFYAPSFNDNEQATEADAAVSTDAALAEAEPAPATLDLEGVAAPESQGPRFAQTELAFDGQPLVEQDFVDAAADYDSFIDAGETAFAQLPRRMQVQYTKAYVAHISQAITTQQYTQIFGEIADEATNQTAAAERAVEEARPVETGPAETAKPVRARAKRPEAARPAEPVAEPVAGNPLEARVAQLRPLLGEKQTKRLGKLIGRFRDGDLDMGRFADELEALEVESFPEERGGQNIRRSERQRDYTPTTVEKIRARLQPLFFSNKRFGDKVVVVQTVAEAKSLPGMRSVSITDGDQAFVDPKTRKVYMIADNIDAGQELAVFLHEVGVHLGMPTLLGSQNFTKLARQIAEWSEKNDGSVEYRLARIALARMSNAAERSEQRGEGFSDADYAHEMIAYFVEEAVAAGIDPTALNKVRGPMAQWFRTLWAAVKSALRKFGLDRVDQLTAQNIVDLAYGAARFELEGTYHGTAAQFRKFDHSYMGAGEGAQAFGWGTYLAQRPGIAKGYFEADVERKTPDVDPAALDTAASLQIKAEILGNVRDLVSSLDASESVRALREAGGKGDATLDGALQRIMKPLDDVNEAAMSGDVLDAHNALGRLANSSLAYLPGVRETWLRSNELFDRAVDAKSVGEKIYPPKPEGSMQLVDVAVQESEMLDWDKPLSEQSPEVQAALDGAESVKDALNTNSPIRDGARLTGSDVYGYLENELGSDQAASEYLDSIGIKGIKFLDAKSRSTTSDKSIVVGGKSYTRKDLVAYGMNPDDPVAPYATTLRVVLRNGVQKTLDDLNEKVSATVERFYDIAKDAAERYKTPFDPTQEARRARADALSRTYEGQQYTWLKDNAAKISVVENTPTKTNNLVIFNDKNIVRVASKIGNDPDRVRYSERLTTPSNPADTALQKVTGYIADKAFDAKHRGSRVGLGWLTMGQLVERGSALVGSLRDYKKAVDAMESTAKSRVAEAASIERSWVGMDQATERLTSNLMRDTTRAQFDPSKDKPDSASKNYAEQVALVQRWNGLPQAGKDKYVEVRGFFEKAMQERKEIWTNALNEAYDSQIAAAETEAKAAGDKKELTKSKHKLNRIKQRKTAALREYTDMTKEMKGPYFPLTRFGRFVAVLESQKYKDAREAFESAKEAGQPVEKLRKAMESLKTNKQHYQVSTFESPSQARRFAESAPEGMTGRWITSSEHIRQSAPITGLNIEPIKEYISEHFDSVTGPQVQAMITEMYFQSLPETHALKSQMKREGIYGESDDMRRAFSATAGAQAHYISRLKHMTSVQKALAAVRNDGKKSDKARTIQNEVEKRVALDMSFTDNPIQDMLVNTSYFAHLGMSPAYVTMNIFQTPMITLPWLYSRHKGWGKAATALAGAYADAGRMVKSSFMGSKDTNSMAGRVWGAVGVNPYAELDFSQVADTNERAMLQTLLERNLLDITITHDLSADARHAGQGLDQTLKIANLPVHVTELVNRATTSLAAYRLAAAEGMSHEKAVEHALRAVEETQLNYSTMNKPRYFREGGGVPFAKMVFQFRMYQQGMLYLIGKSAVDAVKGGSAEQRAEARRMLLGLFATHGVMTGAVGLPTMGAVLSIAGWAMSQLGDDDEPVDLEVEMRNALADAFGKDAGLVLSKGLWAAAGTDMSMRMGLGDIASPMPFFRGDGRTGQESLGRMIVSSGGASLSMLAGFLDAKMFMEDGQYAKGFEKAIPMKGIKDLIRAYRLSEDGVTTRSGETALAAENFGPWAIALRGMGFNPVLESEHYAAKTAVETRKRAAQDTRNRLLRQYAQARLRGEDVSKIMQDIEGFNERHPTRGLRIDRSSMLKAVQARRTNQANTNEIGVRIDRGTKPFEEYGRFAG